MKISKKNRVFLSLASLLIVQISQADDWQSVDRYRVKDGLVKDLKTGLMWTRCSLGQTWNGSTCKGEANRYRWSEINVIAEHADIGGFKDWRVPSHSELKSLVICSSNQTWKIEGERNQCDGDYATPTIVQSAFSNTPASWFWSASPYYEDWFWTFPFTLLGGTAWVVNFSNGLNITSDRDDSGHLRLVRDAK